MNQHSVSDLVVRKLPFDFSGIPFLWNPSMPEFSLNMNTFSFLVLGFERYIIRAFTEAQEFLPEGELKAEALAMKEQEAQHSLNHRRHVNALIKTYPELQTTLKKVLDYFDRLYEKESLQFHLAYIANIEGITPALGRFLIENRSALFATGDARIGSLVLWHFIEELEHRSSAKIVYDALVPNPWYRITTVSKTFSHMWGCSKMVDKELLRLIPSADRKSSFYSNQGTFITAMRRLNLLPFGIFVGLMKGAVSGMISLLPNHNPARFVMPEWVNEWYRGERRGEDMTVFYGRTPVSYGEGEALVSEL